jgi:signal transduction histidine kinase
MRTPLTAISGFAELLMNEKRLQEHLRYVEIIFREAEKLTELVNRFLDARRLKIDRSRIDYRELFVAALLEKARQRTRDCKTEHAISIDCRSDVMVFGNREELIQVFSQLLDNACRYSLEGGEIQVRAETVAGETTVCFSDRGIGIPQHELGKIFEPFHRLDTGDSRITGGVGLGLSVANEIVSLHGGEIRVESTPGEGSTFKVILPLPIQGTSGIDREVTEPNQS